jgi:hypothetical protein
MDRDKWSEYGELAFTGVYVSLSASILPYRVVNGLMPIEIAENIVGGEVVCIDYASRLYSGLS